MATTVIRTLATRVTADAQEFSKEMRRAEKDAERFALSIRRQTRELELGTDEAKLYELSLRGVSGETTKALRNLIEQKKAMEDAREATERLAKAQADEVEQLAARKKWERNFRLEAQYQKQIADEQEKLAIQEKRRTIRLRAQWQAIVDQQKAVEDLAKAEQDRAHRIASSPIDKSEQISISSALPSASEGFGTKELKNLAKVLKGGGILAGFKILAHEFERISEAAEKMSAKMRDGTASANDMRMELVRSIPVIGDVSRGMESWVEVITGEKAFEAARLKAKQTREEFEGLVKSIKDARAELRLNDEQREIADINRNLSEKIGELNEKAIERLKGVSNPDIRKKIMEDAREAALLLKDNADFQIGQIKLRPEKERAGFVNELKKEAQALGLTRKEMVLLQAQQMGLNNVQMESVRLWAEQIENFEDAKKLEEDARKLRDSQVASANAIRESVRTPLEVMRDEIEKVIELVEGSFLDPDTARKRIDQLASAYKDGLRSNSFRVNVLTSTSFGSSQATQSILSAKLDGNQSSMLEQQKKSNGELQKAVRKLEKIEQNTKNQIVVRDLN